MGRAQARKQETASAPQSPPPKPAASADLHRVELMPVDSLAHPIKDVPRIIGVSKATLYRMITAGKIQTRDLGGCVVVRRTDLQALVDSAPLSKKAAQ